jgi:hypothetical protein
MSRVNAWIVVWCLVPVVVGACAVLGGALRRRQAVVLAGTVMSAVGVAASVSAWLLVADPATRLAEALKTGGFASGAVVALYGLWLNDRRRRTEEENHRVESGRVDHERFARAVELLGHEADQVRVGAKHALVALARSNPSYTQTVLDVLCAYLRRPFDHPRYHEVRAPELNDLASRRPGTRDAGAVEADQERQVRLTAERLIAELLPPAGADEQPLYKLDFTGASLEYLDLSQKRVGTMLVRRAALYGTSRFSGTEFHGMAMFTESVFFGRVDVRGALFAAGVSFQAVRFSEAVDMTGVAHRDFADLRFASAPEVLAEGVTVDTGAKVKLPQGWRAENRSGDSLAEVHVVA